MLFTLFVAILAATLWALGSFLLDSRATHDPTTFELAAMAGITLAAYTWMQRLRAIRTQAAVDQLSDNLKSTFAAALDAPEPEAVPNRYAEGRAEIEREAAAQAADHVA